MTKKLIIALVFLVVILSATTFYFYRNSRAPYNPASEIIDQSEAKALSEKVGKLILLPKDEVPTIATVSDPEALKDQPFFSGVKKGDKVLIYSNAKKAVLYDPEAHKVINMAPFDTKNQSFSNGQSSSQ